MTDPSREALHRLKRLKGVAFDLDYTLIDIEERDYRAIAEALKKHGHTVLSRSDFCDLYYQKPYETPNGAGRVLKNLIPETSMRGPIAREYVEIWRSIPELTVALPGAESLLKTLRSYGIIVAVTTRRTNHSRAERDLRITGLMEHIDSVITGYEVGADLGSLPSDQSGELVRRKFLEMSQMEPDMTGSVGDSWGDIRASKRLGMLSIWVRTGFGAYNDFAQEGPDLTVQSLSEFEALVRALGPKTT